MYAFPTTPYVDPSPGVRGVTVYGSRRGDRDVATVIKVI